VWNWKTPFSKIEPDLQRGGPKSIKEVLYCLKFIMNLTCKSKLRWPLLICIGPTNCWLDCNFQDLHNFLCTCVRMFSHDIRSSGHPRRHHPAGVVSNVNPLKKMNHFPSGLQHSQIVQHSKCTRVQLPKNHNRCFLPSNFLHHPLRSRQPCHGGFGWRWRCNRFRSLQKMVAAASEPNFLQHKCGNRFAASNICLHCTKKNI